MEYAVYNGFLEMVSTVGFPAALVLILLFIVYKQNRKFTEALNKNTEAYHALNTSVTILTERVKTT